MRATRTALLSFPLRHLPPPPPPLLVLLPSSYASTLLLSSKIVGVGGLCEELRHQRKRAAVAQCAVYGGGGALARDGCAAVLTVLGSYSLVRAFNFLTARNLIDQKLSRKLVHITSGLLFMASWPLFSTSTEARYFAAVVPVANCLRLLIYGLSLATDKALVQSVTRHGKSEELLKGPMYYVLILILCDTVFWRESAVGIISMSMMCGGDGIADIMGRRYGKLKLPYNRQKSWVGSVSMYFFGFAICIGMLYYFTALGYLQLEWGSTAVKVALVSLVATFVESLPLTEMVDDNISVPVMSMLVAFLLFNYWTPH